MGSSIWTMSRLLLDDFFWSKIPFIYCLFSRKKHIVKIGYMLRFVFVWHYSNDGVVDSDNLDLFWSKIQFISTGTEEVVLLL